MSSPEATPPAGTHDDPAHADLDGALRRRTPLWKPVGAFALLILTGAGVVTLGAIPKAEKSEAAATASERLVAASRRVQLAPVKTPPASRLIGLPVSLVPDMQASVFTQATGYVAERRVDIGDRVRQGDVLAKVDIPLVEQDLRRAQAALAEAEADRDKTLKNLELARTTLDRWRSVQARAVAQQELDERQAAYDALLAGVASAEATIQSRRADVLRLEREKSFGEIIAPFDGVISSRTTEVGDYVTTGSGAAALFTIVRTDTLRASVDIPQAYAYSIKLGQRAKIVVRQIPGKSFDGVVARTSGALDDRTRSLRAEVQVPNDAGELLSGTFATVQLEVPTPDAGVVVPGSAVLVRAEGPRVAILDAQSRIQYLPVKVRRDLGTEVEISEGLEGHEFVVVNMSDEIPAGTTVEGVKPSPRP